MNDYEEWRKSVDEHVGYLKRLLGSMPPTYRAVSSEVIGGVTYYKHAIFFDDFFRMMDEVGGKDEMA